MADAALVSSLSNLRCVLLNVPYLGAVSLFSWAAACQVPHDKGAWSSWLWQRECSAVHEWEGSNSQTHLSEWDRSFAERSFVCLTCWFNPIIWASSLAICASNRKRCSSKDAVSACVRIDEHVWSVHANKDQSNQVTHVQNSYLTVAAGPNWHLSSITQGIMQSACEVNKSNLYHVRCFLAPQRPLLLSFQVLNSSF